jgi:hypothetical protein
VTPRRPAAGNQEDEAMTDDFNETKAFKYADGRIRDLLSKLNAKRVCGCCTGRALMYNAVTLCETTMGSAEAIEMLEGMIIALRENNVPAPDPLPSTVAH